MDMDAYKDVFFAESTDYLLQITDGLLALERNPRDLEPVEAVFRGAHSLKGMAAAMGYARTADLTHKMEGLMDRVRKGEVGVDLAVTGLMLAAVDFVRDLIDDEAAGRDTLDPTELLAALAAATTGEIAEPESAAVATELESGERLFRVKVTLEEGCVLKAVRAYMVIKRLAHLGRVIETHPDAREIEDEHFELSFEVVLATVSTASEVREAALYVSEVESADISEVLTPVAHAARPTDDEAPTLRHRKVVPKLSETQTVRVSIGHLDTMVDLVGELVILRSRLEGLAQSRTDLALVEALDEFQRISTDLQYEVMQTRMVPVGNIFNRFPRMVRDLAIDLGKNVDFAMDGLDIELDRTVLDEIGDPLVHLLRNSVDHGIESPESRIAQGKSPEGRVELSARRERDHVAITVTDDGKGIDLERVWDKAVERGVADGSRREDYDDCDILLFTCLPGFSTAQYATKVSGRGVGMDVVKGKIEHLGGSVQIRSTPGQGTEFILRLPLTMAIVRALIVESAGQWFALPLSAVDEVFRAEDVNVDTVDGSPVLILRDGEVVALRRLDTLLFGADPDVLPEPRSSIVLVTEAGERHAMHVHGLVGRQEVFVKPLSRLLRDSRGYSGATILGDGRVILILDPRTLFSLGEE